MPDARREARRRTALANDAQRRQQEAQMQRALAAQQGPAVVRAQEEARRAHRGQPTPADEARLADSQRIQAAKAARRQAQADKTRHLHL